MDNLVISWKVIPARETLEANKNLPFKLQNRRLNPFSLFMQRIRRHFWSKLRQRDKDILGPLRLGEDMDLLQLPWSLDWHPDGFPRQCHVLLLL